ncbi:MAG: hypothetical protein CMF38_04265 [Legionellaceae bacterium]|nr:hypothetical protein [Legionellaceae bacterium]HCA89478.1 mechanosensitive ion channel family protein [Legionellales bacterium]|tara:strand:+ start:420 stop:1250 length:831 start_codon:yes stop_codon:yes gene_type:complete
MPETMMHILTSYKLLAVGYALALLIAGFFIGKRLSLWLETHILAAHFSRHHSVLMSRAIFYVIVFIFFIASLQQLGFNLSVLLGAAGVFTVALSFASQTAASNLISGIFLLFERPFQLGDTIEVSGITGLVESIDLLSTKLKTFDNTLVRLPNEALIKSNITNLSYFATRRLDLIIGVAYGTDFNTARSVLLSMTHEFNEILKEPAPDVIIQNFAESAIELKFMMWLKTSDLARVKNNLQALIKSRFEAQGIDMPFKQITLHQAACSDASKKETSH